MRISKLLEARWAIRNSRLFAIVYVLLLGNWAVANIENFETSFQ